MIYPAFSIPPFQSSGTTTPSLTITYPKVSYFPESTNITLNFHVYNSTNHIVTNETTSCILHLYSSQNGTHLIEGALSFNSNNLDFYYTIPSTEFEDRNEYPYLVQCTDSIEAGFLSAELSINGSGEEPTLTSVLIYVLPILLLLIFSVILFVGAINSSTATGQVCFGIASYTILMFTLLGVWAFTNAFFMSLGFIVTLIFILAIGLVICYMPLVVLAIIYLFFSIFADERVSKLLLEGEMSENIIEDEKNPFKRYMFRKNLEKRRGK